MRTTSPQGQPRIRLFVISSVACFGICVCSVSVAADPLPSWNDGSTKKAILEFVAAVTDENGKVVASLDVPGGMGFLVAFEELDIPTGPWSTFSRE